MCDQKYIAIGSSTGGTKALENIIPKLPAHMPPVLVVQHMPKIHTKTFAMRLDKLSAVRVKEAEHGEKIEAGTVYIAPGDQHMMVRKHGHKCYITLSSSEKICYQRPSVDVLFRSISEVMGSSSVGVLLTGMGRDGADGLKLMKDSGAHTIAQSQETCVVYGMPRRAVELGAHREILPLDYISKRMIQLTRSNDLYKIAM